MYRVHLQILLVCGLIVFATPSLAFNWLFLSDSPISYMSDEDFDALRASVRKTLDTGSDGETVTWHSESSDASAEIVPINTFIFEGQTCREIRLATEAAGRSGIAGHSVCKNADGNWRVRPE